MVFLAIVLGAAVLCCGVLLVFGCVCHLFKKGHGFTNFENDPETGRGSSMYPVNESAHDMSNITFEPLPDILAKTVGSRALRPRITCSDKDKQSTAAKLVTVYQPFPRNQLLYIKEIGLGWFGQVLQGSAEGILPDSRHTKVVVKILKDDATPAEKSLFLEEVAPYRDLDHPNIVQLLGQCTETSPFLAIMEYPTLGDLKSYLLTQEKGMPYLRFAMDAARGLTHMHKHSYIHHDFAARNCLLMSDLTLKIGDYGIGEDLFREDYYDTGCDLLPIRWMAPESLELKQGVWQPTQFTCQSNVWSLSIFLWEVIASGRKPYANLRDEDVLQRVIREGKTKLPPPNTNIPLHDRWYEIMEMCWQEVNDRPSVEDILSFLQQIDEEASQVPPPPLDQQWNSTQPSSPKDVQVNHTGSPSKGGFESNFVQSKTQNQATHQLAEVLVHRPDDKSAKNGFEDDFSSIVQIKKSKYPSGFSDDFVSGNNFPSDLSQNDSILAYGGNQSEDDTINGQDKFKEILSSDANMNLLSEPVPVQMSTPSKQPDKSRADQSEAYNTALSHQASQNSKFTTATEKTHPSPSSTDNTNSACEVTSSLVASRSSKLSDSTTQNTDEGYRTDINGTPDIVLTTSQASEPSVRPKSDSELLSPDFETSPDIETEKAREIYMSKGAAIPPSTIHKSRSLGTIPEDGIPSDNTSQSGLVFEEPEESEDIGMMNFEWDDYVGEELVGRVRYSSDESTRSPRNIDVEEWPFDQDSNSESHSKPGSLASDSDAEVTTQSIGSNTSIDTRARIASILTNRLNSLIKQTNNSKQSSTGMFYSFSQYDHDLDSPEHAPADSDGHTGSAPSEPDYQTTLSMLTEEEEEEPEEPNETPDKEASQGQDDQLIKLDLDQIAAAVLKNRDVPDVVISEPSDSMLPSSSPSDSLA